MIEATLAIVPLRAVSCAVAIKAAFAVAPEVLLSKLVIAAAASPETSARLVIDATRVMLVLTIPFAEVVMPVAFTVAVPRGAAARNVPSSASVIVLSAAVFVASHGNASLTSTTVSLSSSVSQSLITRSPSQSESWASQISSR